MNSVKYRMPAEWEPHEATWLSWPHNPDTWPGGVVSRIPPFFARMAAEISHGEKVRINVTGPEMEAQVRKLVEQCGANLSEIECYPFPTNDAWVRDHGPIFTVPVGAAGPVKILDWEYNAWGGKYPPYDRDNVIPQQVAARWDLPREVPGMVLEGGSIDVNGQGILLTTEQCLLNPNRNPNLKKNEIEERLRKFLGVQQILWLGEGIEGDDTDGHVDDITRFVAPNTIVSVRSHDAHDENYLPLEKNWERLRGMTNREGRPFDLIELPMPSPLRVNGERLPASYANFYITNSVVLVPIFADKNDDLALGILRECFPGRRVLGLDSRDLVVGLGGIHCVTQQQPKSPRAG